MRLDFIACKDTHFIQYGKKIGDFFVYAHKKRRQEQETIRIFHYLCFYEPNHQLLYEERPTDTF